MNAAIPSVSQGATRSRGQRDTSSPRSSRCWHNTVPTAPLAPVIKVFMGQL